MEETMQSKQDLILENQMLRRALALSMNKVLIRKLKAALDRINDGDYMTEEEFFSQ